MALLTPLLSHAIGNVAAFSGVVHLRGCTKIENYAGMARRQPAAAPIQVLALLSQTDIPLLIGFVGKITLFMATIEGGFVWLALAATANTIASLFYSARVMGWKYFDPPGEQIEMLGRTSAVAM